MATIARRVASSWIDCIGLINDIFFVEFKANKWQPKQCVIYPTCGLSHYQIALANASKGQWLRQWLYKIQPYEKTGYCPCNEVWDYRFNGDYTEYHGMGPDIVPNGGVLFDSSYGFDAGQGLTLTNVGLSDLNVCGPLRFMVI